MSPRERRKVLERLDWERRFVALGGEILEPAGQVVRMHAPDGSHHVIIWSQLDTDTADAVIDREIERHHSLGVSFEWKVYSHDQPSDLKERLIERGFEIGEIESVMIMGIEEARGQDGTESQSESRGQVKGETVRTPEQVELFKRVAEEVFGGDWTYTATQLLAGIQRNDPGHRGYIGYLDGDPASIGRLYVHPESWFGGLYGGGTRPEFRGRGLYKAVVRARMKDAIEWGAKYLMVDARETSRPILERIGFVSLGETWPCMMNGQD